MNNPLAIMRFLFPPVACVLYGICAPICSAQSAAPVAAAPASNTSPLTATTASLASPVIDFAAHRVSLTPQITVQLSSSSNTAQSAAVPAPASLAPSPSVLPISPAVGQPDCFLARSLIPATGNRIHYTHLRCLLCVGTPVLVAPLDGGLINGQPGGVNIPIAADGTVSFTFQAPSYPGVFHVITRLNDVEIALPFEVASSVAASLPPTIGSAAP